MIEDNADKITHKTIVEDSKETHFHIEKSGSV
jgi:hypothetical protein